jgi:DNA-binding transcriptional ArsR family regulator
MINSCVGNVCKINLKRKVALTLLLTLMALSLCFTAAASISRTYAFVGAQPSNHLTGFSAAAPIVISASLHGNTPQPLTQPTRHQIYNYITDNPGVHFRGICLALGLSVGVVQYHLNVLEHAGLINAVADGQNKRFFEHNAFAKVDVELVSVMRHQTASQILVILAENGSAIHRDIAATLDISSQALTWQMNQLKNAELVSAQKVGVNVRYTLCSADMAGIIVSLSGQMKS